MKVEEKTTNLAEAVSAGIDTTGRWRGELRHNAIAGSIEYYEEAPAVKLDESNKVVFHTGPGSIMTWKPPEQYCLFSMQLDGLSFIEVARLVQKKLVLRKGLSSAPSILYPMVKVVHHEPGGNSSEFIFNSWGELNQHLVLDPFDRWRWIRTGCVLHNERGPAIQDLVTGEKIFVMNGRSCGEALLSHIDNKYVPTAGPHKENAKAVQINAAKHDHIIRQIGLSEISWSTSLACLAGVGAFGLLAKKSSPVAETVSNQQQVAQTV